MKRLLILLLACAALFVAACGGDDNEGATATPQSESQSSGGKIQRDAANSKVNLTIGSKNFTEQKVLGEIYAQGLQAAGYNVSKDLNLGDEKTALTALKKGEISAYPEYTGTALTAFFKKDAGDLPKDANAAYEELKGLFAPDGITAFPPTPFTSSNEVAVTEETAQKYGLTNISDLSKVADKLTLYGTPECRKRMDCLLGLQEVYGLKFKRFVPVNIDQRHEVLTSHQADLSIVFTTDPQIKRNDEVLLEDDKGMFPPYNSTFLMKKSVADAAGPDLAKTIDLVNKNLTADVMQELNARVDLDKDTPEQAAQAYLKQFKLIPA